MTAGPAVLHRSCEWTGIFLFGLAPGDAYRAVDVTITAVGSYPTVSPLPEPGAAGCYPAVVAIGGLFSVVLVSDCSAWELPSALPLESGLSSRYEVSSDHPVFTPAPSQYKECLEALQAHYRWTTGSSTGAAAGLP